MHVVRRVVSTARFIYLTYSLYKIESTKDSLRLLQYWIVAVLKYCYYIMYNKILEINFSTAHKFVIYSTLPILVNATCISKRPYSSHAYNTQVK